jgi:hypothetical protein
MYQSQSRVPYRLHVKNEMFTYEMKFIEGRSKKNLQNAEKELDNQK